MHRTALVTAVTTALIAVAALLLLTAAAPAAPRWPAATLDYWTDAKTQLDILYDQSSTAFKLAGQPASAATLSDTVTAVTTAVDALAELDPPPVLLPLHTQLTYAGDVCKNAVRFAQTTTFDGVAAMTNVNLFAVFGLECRRSLRDANVEAARYAATVGGFPETP